MKRATLAIAINVSEGEDYRFTRGQQLLAGEFRRRVQEQLGRVPVCRQSLRGESVQVRFITRRDLKYCRVDLYERFSLKVFPDL
jgi:hypothetical protein